MYAHFYRLLWDNNIEEILHVGFFYELYADFMKDNEQAD